MTSEKTYVVVWDDQVMSGCTTVHADRREAEERFLQCIEDDDEWIDAVTRAREELEENGHPTDDLTVLAEAMAFVVTGQYDHDGEWTFNGSDNSVRLLVSYR